MDAKLYNENAKSQDEPRQGFLMSANSQEGLSIFMCFETREKQNFLCGI